MIRLITSKGEDDVAKQREEELARLAEAKAKAKPKEAPDLLDMSEPAPAPAAAPAAAALSDIDLLGAPQAASSLPQDLDLLAAPAAPPGAIPFNPSQASVPGSRRLSSISSGYKAKARACWGCLRRRQLEALKSRKLMWRRRRCLSSPHKARWVAMEARGARK